MTNITLPRELVEQVLEALKYASGYCDTYAEIEALQNALPKE